MQAPLTELVRARWRAVLALAAVVLVTVIALIVAAQPRDGDRPHPAAGAGSTPATTPAAASGSVAAFPIDRCQPAPLAAGSALGIGVPRAARVVPGSVERSVLDAAVGCLRRIAGATPILRTQVPIDAARRGAAGDDERGELAAFGALLKHYGAAGIVSVRSHDFTRCGRRDAPPAREVAVLASGAPLEPCGYPTPQLYAQLLGEVRAVTEAAAPDTELLWTAWNEPDHPMFTLLDGLGLRGAARRAGQYWAEAAEQLGVDHVLAGEFSDRDLATLLHLRDAFVAGARAGRRTGQPPVAWALHPYRDLTATSPGASVAEQFAAAVAPASLWQTEVTARLSGRGGLDGDAATQYAKGVSLREALTQRPVRAILYLLTPPDASRVARGDTWDSAIADRSGRARPLICGLAGLAPEDCGGAVAAFG